MIKLSKPQMTMSCVVLSNFFVNNLFLYQIPQSFKVYQASKTSFYFNDHMNTPECMVIHPSRQ